MLVQEEVLPPSRDDCRRLLHFYHADDLARWLQLDPLSSPGEQAPFTDTKRLISKAWDALMRSQITIDAQSTKQPTWHCLVQVGFGPLTSDLYRAQQAH